MHPILFRFGSTIIYTYTILLDVGLVCGLIAACLEGKRRGIAPERIVDAALWALVAGMVSALPLRISNKAPWRGQAK